MAIETITSRELKDKYLAFFKSKGHAIISGAPLVPENDPSVLFTTAGMHPLVPYLKGMRHPSGTRLANVQMCLRTTDIDEVGDDYHATAFEMLGNWSLGDYGKREAINYSWEFLTGEKWLNIKPEYLAVTVFAGDENAPRDAESAKIWQELGLPESRIGWLGNEDNWWPAGSEAKGPQGPDTEMFYWTGDEMPPRHFDPSDKRWVEIWNDVFMEHNRLENGSLVRLKQQNVDTGMGVERTVMAINGLKSIYEIDAYQPLRKLIKEARRAQDERQERILADHIKAASWLLADRQPVIPSNSDQGYVLRRLIRRAVRIARQLEIEDHAKVFRQGLELVVDWYGSDQPIFKQHLLPAAAELDQEIKRFDKTISEGMKKFSQLAKTAPARRISGRAAFQLYESYGFPWELTEELAAEQQLTVDEAGFKQALTEHRRRSREGAKNKFKGGLQDHSEKSVHYHTATHLLHQALREVLGPEATQKGSNITSERLRFDFKFGQKMTAEQVKAVEMIVNEKIQDDLPVRREEMTVREAKDSGALGLFGSKYGEKVSVYSIGDWSREICGGPHVSRTGELGKFTIVKEESSGAGIRRIKAILQNR